MKTFHVRVAFDIFDIYRVEAEDAQIACRDWRKGELIYTKDEDLSATVLSVKEVDRDDEDCL